MERTRPDLGVEHLDGGAFLQAVALLERGVVGVVLAEPVLAPAHHDDRPHGEDERDDEEEAHQLLSEAELGVHSRPRPGAAGAAAAPPGLDASVPWRAGPPRARGRGRPGRGRAARRRSRAASAPRLLLGQQAADEPRGRSTSPRPGWSRIMRRGPLASSRTIDGHPLHLEGQRRRLDVQQRLEPQQPGQLEHARGRPPPRRPK